ncbi:hypothetical protein Angca_002308, partial [Angiostrongylus cantonensis]
MSTYPYESDNPAMKTTRTSTPLTADVGTTQRTSGAENSSALQASHIIVSHGETIAEVFPQWLRLAWKRGHYYHAYDLNMPSLIPNRPMEHFRYDPPLSEHGYLSAEVAGHSIKVARYEPFQIYSSPELRCVQTASAIIQAFAPTTIQICIEPSLADWVQFTPQDISKQWLSPQQ